MDQADRRPEWGKALRVRAQFYERIAVGLEARQVDPRQLMEEGE